MKQPELATPKFNSTNLDHENATTNPTKSESGVPKCAAPSTSIVKHGPKSMPSRKPNHHALPTKASQLKAKKLEGVFASLNGSKGEALHQISTSPPSTTTGTPRPSKH